MIVLKDILEELNVIQTLGNLELSIEHAHTDSRKVTMSDLFVAVHGNTVDGHEYISKAIENGSCAIVCESLPKKIEDGVAYIQVINSALAAGICNKVCYGKPDEELRLIGITGTNGKTTITTLLFNLFKNLGFGVGLISTVENRINEKIIPSTHTTPEVSELYQLIHSMVADGVDYCFMEVSSHAISQFRIAGLQFDAAIFSNLTHDHLDYHGSFANYRDTKKQLFDNLSSDAVALVNKDDKNGLLMMQNTKATRYTYSQKSISDFTSKILETDFNGMQIELNRHQFWTPLVGAFNAINLTAVYGIGVLFDIPSTELIIALSKLGKVKGRFELINPGGKNPVIVDYAHTPDALENVIKTINNIRKNSVSLTVVFGCGGDRDIAKRPKMGAIAAENANRVILTNDNPRTEDPSEILGDIEKGIEGQYYKNILQIQDREQAIKTAITTAQAGEVILIAGKGHESYQEVNGVRHDFDDSIVALKIIESIA